MDPIHYDAIHFHVYGMDTVHYDAIHFHVYGIDTFQYNAFCFHVYGMDTVQFDTICFHAYGMDTLHHNAVKSKAKHASEFADSYAGVLLSGSSLSERRGGTTLALPRPQAARTRQVTNSAHQSVVGLATLHRHHTVHSKESGDYVGVLHPIAHNPALRHPAREHLPKALHKRPRKAQNCSTRRNSS